MAGPEGFEPPACRLGGGRSIRLSYGPATMNDDVPWKLQFHSSLPGMTLDVVSLLFSPRGEAKCTRGPLGLGASRLARAGVLTSTLSTASKRNEVLAVVSCASTVGW